MAIGSQAARLVLHRNTQRPVQFESQRAMQGYDFRTTRRRAVAAQYQLPWLPNSTLERENEGTVVWQAARIRRSWYSRSLLPRAEFSRTGTCRRCRIGCAADHSPAGHLVGSRSPDDRLGLGRGTAQYRFGDIVRSPPSRTAPGDSSRQGHRGRRGTLVQRRGPRGCGRVSSPVMQGWSPAPTPCRSRSTLGRRCRTPSATDLPVLIRCALPGAGLAHALPAGALTRCTHRAGPNPHRIELATDNIPAASGSCVLRIGVGLGSFGD